MDNNFEKLYKLSNESKENINIIEGIASEYDTIDKTGEIIRSGAFDSSIGKVIPIQVMHAGVFSTVGTATLEKSGKKLLIKGELFDNEMGKTIALAKSKGVQYNLSIGGKREDWAWESIDGKEVIVTKKGVINEVSITGESQQAHPSAIVTKTLNENKEETMSELNYVELAKALATEMDKAELGKKSNEEMKKMQEEIGSLKEQIEKSKESDVKLEELTKVLEKMDKTINELSAPGNFGENGLNKSMEAEMENFNKALHNKELDGAEFAKAMTTTDGASLIPQLLANEIIKDMREFSPFYADSKTYRGKGKSIEIPVRDSWTNTVEAVAEGSGVVTQGKLTYTTLEIAVGVIQSEMPVTDEMRDDSAFNIASEIREAVSEDFGAYLSEKILKGVYATDKFEGITVNTTVTTAALETSSALTVIADDLLDLEMKLKKQYRIGAKYYVSSSLYALMKKFKNEQGDYLWQNPITQGSPATFNGYPVVECPDMDVATTAGKFPCIFANLDKGYALFERIGMETEMDRLASTRIWNTITRMRIGGKVKNPKAIALLKVKAGA